LSSAFWTATAWSPTDVSAIKPGALIRRSARGSQQATHAGGGKVCEQQRRGPGSSDRLVRAARGAFDHMSVAVLAKDARGVLQVERHGSAAKDLALSGAVLSAALLVVAPAVDATVMAAAAGLPGAQGIAAHLRHVIPDEKLQELSELLGSGECGLLVVAIDRRGTEISPLLEQAEKAAVVETKTGDLDAAFYRALGAATTTGHAAPCRHARATGPMGPGAWSVDRGSAMRDLISRFSSAAQYGEPDAEVLQRAGEVGAGHATCRARQMSLGQVTKDPGRAE
jgi:hypothetical protein